MDLEQAKVPGTDTAYVKFYPRGKFRVYARGPKEYLSVAEECLKWGVCDAWAKVDKEAFGQKLREKNVPEAAIREFVENVSLSDDMWAETAD